MWNETKKEELVIKQKGKRVRIRKTILDIHVCGWLKATILSLFKFLKFIITGSKPLDPQLLIVICLIKAVNEIVD